MYRIHSRSYGTNERRTSACSYIHYPRFDFYPYQAGEKRSSSGSSAKRFFWPTKNPVPLMRGEVVHRGSTLLSRIFAVMTAKIRLQIR